MPGMNMRKVLVTGGSGGLGAAIAVELAKQGFDIAVHYNSNLDSARGVVEEIISLGKKAELLQFDVSERESTRQKLEDYVDANGAFYGVVCNAGITRDAAFPALTGEQWDSVLRTNLDGFYNVLHPLIMPMIRLRQGGRIVALSSVSGLAGNRGQVNYSAAKSGIIGASKALAIELAKRQITVNCVAPGLIETEMTSNMDTERALQMIPMARFGQAADVAALVGFLMSDPAGYITRQVFSVNGGMY